MISNLCRTGRYQGRGYYVSLLAEARGQRSVEDLRAEAYVRALEAEIQPLVHETLHHDESERFELNVYLGKHPSHQALAEQLFAKVRAPLLRVMFARAEGSWRPTSNVVEVTAVTFTRSVCRRGCNLERSRHVDRERIGRS